MGQTWQKNTFADAQKNLTPWKKRRTRRAQRKRRSMPSHWIIIFISVLIPREVCAVVLVLGSRGHCLFVLKGREKGIPERV